MFCFPDVAGDGMNGEALSVAVAIGPYSLGSIFLFVKRVVFGDAAVIMDTMNLAIWQRDVLSLFTDTPVTNAEIQVSSIIKYNS